MQVRIGGNITGISIEDNEGRIFNSYLIEGEKYTALVDSAPSEFSDCFIERLSEVTDIKKIDYFIFTHTDSLRAGTAEQLIELNSNARVCASIAGLRNLKEILNKPVNEMSAKDSAVIDLGGISLKIVITPNLNWPDTMMLYIEESRLLLSGTMFVRYGSDASAEDYFRGELEMFSDFAKSALERVKTLHIRKVYPSEGYGSDARIINLYESFLDKEKETAPSAAIIYAGTENGFTSELVRTVEKTMKAKGIRTKLINCAENTDYAVKAMNSADMLCFASPTIYRKAVPEIMDIISRIDRVNKLRTPCIVIGSYGWGGEALGFMANYLKLMKLSVFEKPFGVVFKPSDKDKEELKKFTERFIDEVLRVK
ncbi:MAG: hypothetical protein Q4G33_05050 [bacterium]|nr:hypothetical protein [bacterium]